MTPDQARKLLAQPDRTLAGAEVLLFKGPMIYVWRRDERVLYVGMSARGLGRPLDTGHHRLCEFQADDALDLYFADHHTVQDLEEYAILGFRPELNGPAPRAIGTEIPELPPIPSRSDSPVVRRAHHHATALRRAIKETRERLHILEGLLRRTEAEIKRRNQNGTDSALGFRAPVLEPTERQSGGEQ